VSGLTDRDVMAGLVPAIHVFAASRKQDVDARHKAGHDEHTDEPAPVRAHLFIADFRLT